MSASALSGFTGESIFTMAAVTLIGVDGLAGISDFVAIVVAATLR